ncbi:polysaccharide biosynthesis/export family protein [Ruficoccus amylovorans]|uniref:Polysaccharide biosynthesis/export family protein n=1 Tax=Ruficoccus amylovorans TaxID=1804625 RepID=A0A842HKM8_9BACT|nr:polysaccharide biosynthesis/export family protein [Ruficoccus amylovorans]MBC2596086.1 polysaccharide biosynthesis/export family protein [Ruficoccus amylovorans]
MSSLLRVTLLLPLVCFLVPFLSAQNEGASGTGGDSSGGGATAPATSPLGATGVSAGVVAGNYVLQPLDVVQVDVFQEPELQVQTRLSADGTVSLPLVGELVIGGMTVDNAQKLVTQAYKGDYLINPHVTILVLQYTERFIYVHGMVNRPGPVPIPPERELTLSEAINSAGGLTRLARRGNIKIRRVNPEGKTEVITVDFDDILESPEVSDIKLKNGDHVIVAERII